MADSKCIRQLGDIRVTALHDGFDDLPITVVVNIDEAGAAALAELSPGNDLLHPVFNAYLVETGGRRLLIDAGGGVHMGPNAGKVLESLAKAGFAPDDVDAIILTHCHPDHILGIVDGDWNAVFPSAELVVPELDEQFWLRSNPSKIENEYQRFEMGRAQKAAAPYSGRTRTITDGEVAPGITIVPLLRKGAVGCITASGNVNVPGIKKVYDNWRTPQADALQAEITTVRKTLQAYPMVPALKRVVAHFHDDPDWAAVRPPMVALDRAQSSALLADLARIGFTLAERTRAKAA